MAGTREEGHRLQGHIGFTHGEHANNEAISDFSLNSEMQLASILQRGYCGDLEIHGYMEAKLGGIQRSFEDFGMKYDGGGNNDA